MNYIINAAGNIQRLRSGATVDKGEEVFTDEASLLDAVTALFPDKSASGVGSFLVQTYNRLPGVRAVKKFENREIAIKRIVKATCGIQVPVAETPAPKQPKATKAPKAAAKAKPAPKGAADSHRESKKAQIIEMLRHGVTRERIQEVTGWAPHSVRGMISTLGKSHRITVTKDAEKVRTYTLES